MISLNQSFKPEFNVLFIYLFIYLFYFLFFIFAYQISCSNKITATNSKLNVTESYILADVVELLAQV